MSDVTRILTAIEQGDGQAREQLLPLVYDISDGGFVDAGGSYEVMGQEGWINSTRFIYCGHGRRQIQVPSA